jgi:hypothetical protein
MKSATDKLARIYGEFALFVTPSVDLSVTTGVLLQATANNLLAVSVEESDDYDVEKDLNPAFYTVASGLNAAEIMSNLFATSLAALQTHYAAQSDSAGFAEYLTATNNPTGSLNEYNVLVDAWLQDFWTYTQGTAIDAESVMTKPIHPDWRGTTYTDDDAMGSRAVGGAFGDGYSVDAAYGACVPTVEVVDDFTGGSAPPVITVTGDDAEGGSVVWTATVTGGNNPTGTTTATITPAITTPGARLTVAVSSLDGIVTGTVVKVNSGDTDEEVILVEEIDGGATTITAVFLKSHIAGSGLTFHRTFTLTPATVTSRLRDVTDITITGDHVSGQIRVTGLPERVAI